MRPVEIRLYDYLFQTMVPEEEPDWLSTLNPNSEVIKHGLVEECVFQSEVGDRFQAERIGFFVVDSDSVPGEKLVINRIVSLKEAKDRE